jgi:hypothetical protein
VAQRRNGGGELGFEAKLRQATDGLRGSLGATIGGRPAVVEYEPDPDLGDAGQVSLLNGGGIEASLRLEVLLYASDAQYVPDRVKNRLPGQPHPLLLQSAAAEPAGGDSGQHSGAWAGD